VQDDVVTTRIEIANPSIEALFEREAPRLWRSLWLHSADRELASDVTAEAFAQLLRRGSAVRDPKAWVWRAAFRIADGEHARRRQLSDPVVETSYEMPEPVVDLVRALRVLPTSQRRAVVLHHLGDLSVAEIARLLGTSRSAVGVHLHRGRRRLRELLEDDDA
jgi:RNA polymerase sigma-70 factor (ECF subfamily)